MSKYKIKTLALLLAIPFIFTACTIQDLPLIGGLFSGTAKEVTLNVWGMWESVEIYQPVIDQYIAENPNVTINYEDLSVLQLNDLVEYKSRVFSRAEQSDWEVDVVMVHNSWVSRLQPLLSAIPKDVLTLQQYAEMFYPVAADSGVVDGELYALPAYYDGLALVYNMEHFEEIGQAFAPTGWEEFRRIAQDLTIRDEGTKQISRAGAAIGGADNIDHFSDILGLMWAQAGVNIPEDIDSQPAQDAFAFYISMLQDDVIWSDGLPEATTAFVEGQVSMLFVPSWKILDILRASPDMEIGVAPVPQIVPDNPAAWGSFWMYAVPGNSDNQKAAWDFLSFLMGEEQQMMLFSEASSYRLFGSPFGLVSLAGELFGDAYLEPVLETAPIAKSAEIASRAGNRRQVEALQEAVNDVLSGDFTVEEVLTTAKEIINQ